MCFIFTTVEGGPFSVLTFSARRRISHTPSARNYLHGYFFTRPFTSVYELLTVDRVPPSQFVKRRSTFQILLSSLFLPSSHAIIFLSPCCCRHYCFFFFLLPQNKQKKNFFNIKKTGSAMSKIRYFFLLVFNGL